MLRRIGRFIEERRLEVCLRICCTGSVWRDACCKTVIKETGRSFTVVADVFSGGRFLEAFELCFYDLLLAFILLELLRWCIVIIWICEGNRIST